MCWGRDCSCTHILLLFSLEVDGILRKAMLAPGLAAMSALVIHNDTVLWTGNFGRKNGSDPNSGTPNEYTMYRLVGCPPGSQKGYSEWQASQADVGGRTFKRNVAGAPAAAAPAAGPDTSIGDRGPEKTRKSLWKTTGTTGQMRKGSCLLSTCHLEMITSPQACSISL